MLNRIFFPSHCHQVLSHRGSSDHWGFLCNSVGFCLEKTVIVIWHCICINKCFYGNSIGENIPQRENMSPFINMNLL